MGSSDCGQLLYFPQHNLAWPRATRHLFLWTQNCILSHLSAIAPLANLSLVSFFLPFWNIVPGGIPLEPICGPISERCDVGRVSICCLEITAFITRLELLAYDASCFVFADLNLHRLVTFNTPPYFVQTRYCPVAGLLLNCCSSSSSSSSSSI